MCDIPKELLEKVRDHFDALLYWAEGSDIDKELWDNASDVFDEFEKYVPFLDPIEEATKLMEIENA